LEILVQLLDLGAEVKVLPLGGHQFFFHFLELALDIIFLNITLLL